MSTFGTRARQAARSPTSGQKKTSHHHGGPPPQPMEELFSPTYHPPALAKAHAHEFLQYYGGDSSSTAPCAAVDPPASNKFVTQGPYRARMYQRNGHY